MFSRAAANPMDEPVLKATDENLTTENWELILGVCDRVDADNENGARNAIAAIQKRLGHRNANVQLFSLSLAEALSKNCGSKVHREIASRAFTQSLMRLLNDRTIHAKVKSRIAELVKQWAEEFRKDPSLGIMAETYSTLKSQGISAAPPPSRPQKREITSADRKREEEELQIALAMSLNEVKIANNAPVSSQANMSRRNEIDNGPNAYTVQRPQAPENGAYTLPTTSSSAQQYSSQNNTTQAQQAPVAERTAATVSRVRALYDFSASEAGELTFRRGDVIQVIESAYKDWWRGSLHGNIGIFPTNYVEKLAEPTPADLQREAQEEQRIFAEAKNVEKLLSILSNADTNTAKFAENDQLQDLYHSTISIRPKLVRLIEKYAQKKDDLISLNEKFMKARRDYDELMEASLARYSTNTYASRQPHDPRQVPQQSAMYSGGNLPPAGYQRQQYHGSTRPQGQTANTMHDAYAHQRPNQNGPGVFQQQPRPSYSQQRAPQLDANVPDYYRATDMNSRRNDVQERQATPSRGQNPPMSPIALQSSGRQGPQSQTPSEPIYDLPTSPSQELREAFPSVPQTIRTTSYDHERAEREGGPPIAYYTENVEPVTHQDGALEQAPTSHLAPSAPGYPADEEDNEIPDYYRRAN